MSLKKCQEDNIKLLEYMNDYSFTNDRCYYCEKAGKKTLLQEMLGGYMPGVVKLIQESDEKHKDMLCKDCVLHLPKTKQAEFVIEKFKTKKDEALKRLEKELNKELDKINQGEAI